jgi:hypothetical protein
MIINHHDTLNPTQTHELSKEILKQIWRVNYDDYKIRRTNRKTV